MSFEAMGAAVKAGVGNSSQKLILLLLASYADEDGQCWPSQTTLAELASMDTSTVARTLAKLEETGFIERESRYREDGGRQSDMIRLLFLKPGILPGPPRTVPGYPAPSGDVNGGPVVAMSPRRPTTHYADPSRHHARTPPPHHAATPHAQNRDPPGTEQGEPPAPCRVNLSEEPITESVTETRARPLSAQQARALRIYDAAPDVGKERTSPAKIARALEDVDDPEAVTVAMIAYLHSSTATKEAGRFCKAPHAAIGEGHWRKYAEKPPVTEQSFLGETYAVPPDAPPDLKGTWDRPGLAKQVCAMQEWDASQQHPASWRRDIWGPPPGEEGCRFFPSVLERHLRRPAPVSA